MSRKPWVGPTGKYPQGMLNADDEGELQFTVLRDTQGNVVLNFGKSVAWLAMPPEMALNLAKLLLKHAGAKKIEIEF